MSIDKSKLKKLAIPLDEYLNQFTEEERKQIEVEKIYLEMVMALRQLRNNLGLTQAELAEKTKIPRTTISKVESGSRNTTLHTLMIMAQAMGKKLELKLR